MVHIYIYSYIYIDSNMTKIPIPYIFVNRILIKNRQTSVALKRRTYYDDNPTNLLYMGHGFH